MKKILRCGLIGVGGIGGTHLKALNALEKEGIARLICVADPFVDKLADVKTTLDSRGIRWHTDYQKLLEVETELDAVVIATPIHLHGRMTAAALARGVFVYLEKPPVPLIQQLNDLIALDNRGKVAVGFQYISSQQLRQLKQWKVEGVLGNVESIRVSAGWSRQTKYYERAPWVAKLILNDEPVFDGPMTNALAHMLHNVMFLAGKGMDDFDVPCEIEAELYRARPIESYDTACLRGRFESGLTFVFSVTHATQKYLPYTTSIMSDRGKAWITNDGKEMGNSLGLQNPAPPYSDPFLESYRDFVEFAQGKRSRAVTRLEDARGYVLATNAALVSSAGIHAIEEQYTTRYGSGETEGWDVPGIVDSIEASGLTGRLFSELEVPWARKANPLSVRSLRSIQLKDYISS